MSSFSKSASVYHIARGRQNGAKFFRGESHAPVSSFIRLHAALVSTKKDYISILNSAGGIHTWIVLPRPISSPRMQP